MIALGVYLFIGAIIEAAVIYIEYEEFKKLVWYPPYSTSIAALLIILFLWPAPVVGMILGRLK